LLDLANCRFNPASLAIVSGQMKQSPQPADVAAFDQLDEKPTPPLRTHQSHQYIICMNHPEPISERTRRDRVGPAGALKLR
jgi:hypothetical protein